MCTHARVYTRSKPASQTTSLQAQATQLQSSSDRFSLLLPLLLLLLAGVRLLLLLQAAARPLAVVFLLQIEVLLLLLCSGQIQANPFSCEALVLAAVGVGHHVDKLWVSGLGSSKHQQTAVGARAQVT